VIDFYEITDRFYANSGGLKLTSLIVDTMTYANGQEREKC